MREHELPGRQGQHERVGYEPGTATGSKALTEQGGACDGGDVETWLDASERWLRADVIESVEACESEVGAEDLTACVVRWLRVIGG